MSDTKDNGGTAFPGPTFTRTGYPNGHSMGMTLRDWFAGQALATAWDARDKGYYDGDDSDMAMCAYQIADAMLEARK
jgi:hypothetical protein